MMTKKKSVDTNAPEQPPPPPSQQQQQQQQKHIIQPLSNLSSIPTETFEPLLTEPSLDSYESSSPLAITPPPAKPPRHSEESASSSSTDIHSPPTKPPRHFSLYSNENEEGLIQQTDNVVKKVLNLVDTFGIISENDTDMTILRQTPPPPIFVQQPSTATEFEREESDTAQTPDAFNVEPEPINLDTDSVIATDTFDESPTLNTTAPFPTSLPDLADPSLDESTDSSSRDKSPPYEITQLATNLTENIFQEIEKELERQERLTKDNNDREDQFEEPPTTHSFPLDAPPLIQSFVTTQPSSAYSTSRPLMFVSHDPTFNVKKPFVPILDIVTTKSIPKITTSITVISPAEPEVSSTTTITTMNLISDDEEQLNSSSTLVPNSSIASDRSKFLQSSSKDSSIDSNDTIPSDNTNHHQQYNTGSATPARSLISDYDNLHGSYGSLNDDNPQLPPPPSSSASSETVASTSTTATSSMSTIYESLDTIPSSSTSTYVTAMNTLTNSSTSGSETAIERLNSDISDEDLVESHEIETPILTSVNPFRTSKGRIASHHIIFNIHKHEISFWHVIIYPVFSLPVSDQHDHTNLSFLLIIICEDNNKN